MIPHNIHTQVYILVGFITVIEKLGQRLGLNIFNLFGDDAPHASPLPPPPPPPYGDCGEYAVKYCKVNHTNRAQRKLCQIFKDFTATGDFCNLLSKQLVDSLTERNIKLVAAIKNFY